MMHGIVNTTRSHLRRAVTLVEVIFSVGVVLIGLLGLLSILPLAARRADDALNLNSGAALAESVFDELMTRKLLSNGQLGPFDPNLSSFDTTTGAFIIDPMYCSGYEFEQNQTITTSNYGATTNGYDQSAFPYFDAQYNPTADPSVPASINWAADQPRLPRFGVLNAIQSAPVASGAPARRRFIDYEQALALVESPDDLNVIRPDDKALPSTIKGLQPTDGTFLSSQTWYQGGIPEGKRVTKSRYSWFATVNPFPDGEHASVSVVVMRDRERNFVVRSGAADNPEENMQDERVTHVVYQSGFRNGAGGLATLRGSTAVVDQLRSNDWVMLSRQVSSGQYIHRWYRIASVSGDATIGPSSSYWEYQVMLDGPDWDFGTAYSTNGNLASQTANRQWHTYATLVRGVVSVTERTVRIIDL